MKPHNVRLFAFLGAGLSASLLMGAPSIGAVRATPMTAVIGTPTEITATASITDATLIPGSVDLIQLNPNGTSTVLGTLHDDGLTGDAFAGDGVFTYVATLNQASVSQVQLEVSAAFKGVLARVKSPMSVFFQAANAAIFVNRRPCNRATGREHYYGPAILCAVR